MLLKNAFLCFFGLASGTVIAAGVFAFLAMIGIFPRLIGKTGTRGQIMLYETVIIIGGALGNMMDIFEFPIGFGGDLLLAVWGLSVGIFVGCLVMSLAETLKALPIFCRRICLGTGLPYVILALGAGKMAGALIYFAKEMGG